MSGRLLTSGEVAEQLGVAVKTLYQWHSQRPKKGPLPIKVGKFLRWKQADVDAWIDAQSPESNVTPIRRAS